MQDLIEILVSSPTLTSSILGFVFALFFYLGMSGKKEDKFRERNKQQDTRKQPVKREYQKYTKEEVSKHNTEEDCWIIVDGKVYDVTSYVEDHKGGDAILRNAGGDSSVGFHGPQHPETARSLLRQFLIGEISS